MADIDALVRALSGGVPTPRERPAKLIEALSMFPGLGNPDVGYVSNPSPNPQNYLEYWSATEPGTDSYRRPSALPLGKPGIEIQNPATRPIDVAADLVSHQLVETDPPLIDYYQQFQKSLTPQQGGLLQDQYKHAQSEGETRPFDSWKQHSGLPAYFRGYAFNQWPDEFNRRAYTPEQRTMFDQMLNYLRTPKK